MNTAATPAARDITAPVHFLDPITEKPFSYTYEPSAGTPWRNATYSPRQVRVRDARRLLPAPTLDTAAFAFAHHESKIRDLYDDAQVRAVYYPEMERLLRETTGAEKVVLFDHTVRNGARETRGADGVREPAARVHNDYTFTSAPQCVRDLLPPDEAAARLKNHYAIINVWRPIKGPVHNKPLAVADARSVSPDDYVASDLIYRDRRGEIYSMKYSDAQRWYYYPRMQPNEVRFLKCFYSASDGRARFTAHGAFDDPTEPVDAPPRESIEIRALVFFPPT